MSANAGASGQGRQAATAASASAPIGGYPVGGYGGANRTVNPAAGKPPAAGKHAMKAKDPLLHMGHDRINKNEEMKDEMGTIQAMNKRDMAHRVFVLTACPTAVFLTMVVVLAIGFNFYPATMLAFCAAALLASAFVAGSVTRKRWQKWLGPLLMLAVVGGTIGGLNVYYRYMVHYYHYRDAPKKTNVAAMQPAIMFEDAGMVTFKDGTVVDRSRALGYQSATAGVTLCAAPIVDSSMPANAEISFFAVGVDCCDWRAKFWCDDAGSADGIAGALLHFDADQIVSPLTAWLVETPVTRENFKPVFDLEQATFGLHISESTRLLRWSKDPVKLRNQYWYHALLHGLALTLVAGAFFFVGGILATVGAKRINKYVNRSFVRKAQKSGV